VERLWNIPFPSSNITKPTAWSDSTKVPETCKLLPIHRLEVNLNSAFRKY
jgi:hypothetical protein